MIMGYIKNFIKNIVREVFQEEPLLKEMADNGVEPCEKEHFKRSKELDIPWKIYKKHISAMRIMIIKEDEKEG